jgi:hypothetical protein
MGKINAEWHKANRMPKNPTREQRLDWHLRHSEACSCREMPPALRDEVAQWRSASSAS